MLSILKTQNLLNSSVMRSVLDKAKDQLIYFNSNELIQFVCLLNSDIGREVAENLRTQVL